MMGNKVLSVKIILTMAIVSALVSAGYFLMHTRAGRSFSPAEKVTIAYTSTTHAMLTIIAKQQGYYEQEGLDPVEQKYSYGKLALEQVLKGKADFATVAETPIMFAIMRGAKISVIATIQTSNRDNAIIARKDRGILRPGDLKGRIIGATFGTTSDFFMDSFLATHRISRGDMFVLDLKPDQLQKALEKGDVDAISASNPIIHQVRNKMGDRGIVFYDENVYTWTFNIVALQDFIRRNPGKVKKMLRALIRAEEFARRNPAKAREVVADFTRADPTVVRDVWANVKLGVALEQQLVIALEDESRWAMKNGFTPRRKLPNYLDYIYFDGLESVKPEAVRIPR